MEELAVPPVDRIDPKIRLTAIADLALGIISDVAAAWDERTPADERLGFVAKYFDALAHSGKEPATTEYARILAAAAYYLSDLAGNATVLSRRPLTVPVEELGYAEFLRRFLADPITLGEVKFADEHALGAQLESLRARIVAFLKTGDGAEVAVRHVDDLRTLTYSIGEARQVVLVDLLRAAVRRHVIRTSPWTRLPEFSELPKEAWADYLSKRSRISELWPSQLAIGAEGVLAGASAAIQVPTSGGKTKAVSLVIRSAFLAKRAEHAVVVAPFNALCREIAADLAQDFQGDRDVRVGVVPDTRDANTAGLLVRRRKAIAILTPEKLDYLLRLQPALAGMIGLIVYDEGHLIDAQSRGPMFELLLSSLKQRLRPGTQVLFISAVAPNIGDIGKWLIGQDCAVISGSHLMPTSRSYAMVNWDDGRRLEFISEVDPNTDEFWVPKILDQHIINGEEFPAMRTSGQGPRRVRYRDPGHIAMLLASRLVKAGGVAVFCGRKDTAIRLARETSEAFAAGLKVAPPSTSGDARELRLLKDYFDRAMEPDCATSRACGYGILVHHGNIPLGARLCVEHAIQKQHARVVLCTSTLAQGVNLPIRYLLISSTIQGGSPIAPRDFHNLIGRAGRAGRFTEGVVVFTDPRLFAARAVNGYAWSVTKPLLGSLSAETCASRLLTCLQEPLRGDRDRWQHEVEHVKAVIESFLLLSLGDTVEPAAAVEMATTIAKNTLAYTQGTPTQQEKLVGIFSEAAGRVVAAGLSPAQRAVFARTGRGVAEALDLAEAVAKRQNEIDGEDEISDLQTLLAFWWPVVFAGSTGLLKQLPEEIALAIAQGWLSGNPMVAIKTKLEGLTHGGNRRRFSIEDCVELCEDDLGFEVSLLVGAVAELLGDKHEHAPALRQLQRGLKIGLEDTVSMAIFDELFPDRFLAQEVRSTMGLVDPRHILAVIVAGPREVAKIVARYPAYFRARLDNLLASLQQ